MQVASAYSQKPKKTNSKRARQNPFRIRKRLMGMKQAKNQLETTGATEEHVPPESIHAHQPTPLSTPPSTLPPDPPHTQPQPASAESSPTI
ncbi:hypothetical protein BLNAU_7212 [Blattamonas nauphoetae]|uniref:Uncharacterized protein n=1 Tax=Blattamonas nauphoetae TaxID=2049346 RepID=A0ABQ9Y210_9EUKA|nr:hypothetical protein BLNAU_7212 [Blattamonas nauphoetae]